MGKLDRLITFMFEELDKIPFFMGGIIMASDWRIGTILILIGVIWVVQIHYITEGFKWKT